MKLIECTKCGSNELFEENGLVVCAYCRLKFVPNTRNFSNSGSEISIYDDIQNLLDKCRNDPANRKRYANLILDLDPSNIEVKQYLR